MRTDIIFMLDGFEIEYIRVNNVGYLPKENSIISFSHEHILSLKASDEDKAELLSFQQNNFFRCRLLATEYHLKSVIAKIYLKTGPKDGTINSDDLLRRMMYV